MLAPRKIRRTLNLAKHRAARKAYVMRMKKAESNAFAYYAAVADKRSAGAEPMNVWRP